MLSTIQLFLALGFGRFALVADLVLMGVGVAIATVVATRRRGTTPPPPVVAEAEAVLASAPDHQPARVS